MYHKIRNTLTALSLAMGVIMTTALFSGPAPADAMAPAPAPVQDTSSAEERIAIAAVKLALAIAASELARETASTQAPPSTSVEPESPVGDVTSTSGLRLQLGMPYYSFGAMLPRRRES